MCVKFGKHMSEMLVFGYILVPSANFHTSQELGNEDSVATVSKLTTHISVVYQASVSLYRRPLQSLIE